MDPYSFALWLGFAGLVIMAVLGAAGGHGSHGHELHGANAHGFHLHGTGQHGLSLHGHATHHHAPAGHAPAGHSPTSHSSAAGHQGHSSAHAHPSIGTRMLNWVSPRVLFAVALGTGATGLLTAPYVALEPLRGFYALVGGIGLEKLIISPLWSTLMRFASRPARTLETAVLEDATALTAFDKDGCGLVAIDLDGHEMRILARLRPDQRTQRIRSGDRLIIEEVDTARNQCRVAIPEVRD